MTEQSPSKVALPQELDIPIWAKTIVFKYMKHLLPGCGVTDRMVYARLLTIPPQADEKAVLDSLQGLEAEVDKALKKCEFTVSLLNPKTGETDVRTVRGCRHYPDIIMTAATQYGNRGKMYVRAKDSVPNLYVEASVYAF